MVTLKIDGHIDVTPFLLMEAVKALPLKKRILWLQAMARVSELIFKEIGEEIDK